MSVTNNHLTVIAAAVLLMLIAGQPLPGSYDPEERGEEGLLLGRGWCQVLCWAPSHASSYLNLPTALWSHF